MSFSLKTTRTRRICLLYTNQALFSTRLRPVALLANVLFALMSIVFAAYLIRVCNSFRNNFFMSEDARLDLDVDKTLETLKDRLWATMGNMREFKGDAEFIYLKMTLIDSKSKGIHAEVGENCDDRTYKNRLLSTCIFKSVFQDGSNLSLRRFEELVSQEIEAYMLSYYTNGAYFPTPNEASDRTRRTTVVNGSVGVLQILQGV